MPFVMGLQLGVRGIFLWSKWLWFVRCVCHLHLLQFEPKDKYAWIKYLSWFFGTAARTDLVDCVHWAGKFIWQTLISQSALCAFASAFTLVTLALCVKCRRTLKGTLVAPRAQSMGVFCLHLCLHVWSARIQISQIGAPRLMTPLHKSGISGLNLWFLQK